MGSDDEFNKSRELFLETCRALAKTKTGAAIYNINEELANEVFGFVTRQINEFSDQGVLNQQQHDLMLAEADRALFDLVYLTEKYWVDEPMEKEAIEVSGRNYLKLKFSTVLYGRAREVELAEIAAKQQVNINNR